ncbi:MAG: hypothetical protein ACTSYV_03270 [Candidatus Heimdallarchaeaceae archaeon]
MEFMEESVVLTKYFEIMQHRYGIIILFFENAISIFLFEDSPKLGSVALSVPGTEFMPASTLYVSGTTEQLFVKLLGERIATKFHKLVLTSLNLKNTSSETFSLIVEKIEKEIIAKKS